MRLIDADELKKWSEEIEYTEKKGADLRKNLDEYERLEAELEEESKEQVRPLKILSTMIL